MLRLGKLKRLDRASKAIESAPISKKVVDEAFELFKETGELPDYRRLAIEVVRRADEAARGGNSWIVEKMKRGVEHFQAMCEARSRGEDYEPPPEPECLTRTLLYEAVDETEFVRIAARNAIRVLVKMGRDVTDPDFVDPSVEMPDFGSVGLHLLGFPEVFAVSPYEDQAQRLFDRMAALRPLVRQRARELGDESVYEDHAAVSHRFLHTGELPEEGLFRDLALMNAEWVSFIRNYLGEPDRELMKVLDTIGTSEGAVRCAAIGALQELARQGRIVDFAEAGPSARK